MMRKVRKDSKLHGLLKEQRALVNKWLFDKGLAYQQMSEACLTMFGLKVSKSSVARYHEREARGKVKRVSGRVGKCVREGKADKEVSGWAKEMCVGMLGGRGTSETGDAYQQTLAWMTKWALEEMQWPVEDERDIKTVLRFMRILISARRERNEADMMKLARRKFEMKAARECLHVMTEKKGVRQAGVTSLNRETLQRRKRAEILTQRRAEKDPMMMWDFPDGQAKPARNDEKQEGETRIARIFTKQAGTGIC